MSQNVTDVLEVRRAFASAIIAGSPFYGPNDLVGAAMTVIVERASAGYIRGPKADRDTIEAFLSHAEAAGLDLRVSAPSTDSPEDTVHVADLVDDYSYAWGRAGYLLGLAVGMQLGPHAFDGIDDAKGRR
jgi:hypothetical protein